MPIAKNVEAQTVKNKWDEHVAAPILVIVAKVAVIRSKIVQHNLVGEFTEQQISALLAAEEAIEALAALPGITQSAAQVVPTHRGQAIEIEGVND